ncbi:unnamed protein product [Dovyalis caffra]|uniref:B3 domain-containing protein n=1 Tax=Dovyalis caffra TaxID=77055 RepID=A0AAV1SF05_9ROSI|nr:unnamed protein product [Dovyalis caffra]
MVEVSNALKASLIAMDRINPSEVEEQKERREEEEEEDVLWVTQKDLKERNVDIEAKVSPWRCLLMVCDVANEKYEQKEREVKEKNNAILEDGKLGKLKREKVLKKPAEFKKEKIVREKLLGSAIKSYEIRYGVDSNFKNNEIEVILNQKNEVKDPMPNPIRDVLTTRKRTSASVEWLSYPTKSYTRNGFKPRIMTEVNDEELNQGLYLRENKIFKLSYAQDKSKGSKSNKKSKQERPTLDLGSLAELPEEVKERIAYMKGKAIELVIEKQLYQTDMKDGNSRLSIPLKQVISKDFLKDNEKSDLRDGKCLEVKILEPSLEMVSNMNMKQWIMAKENGNVSSSYVFITHWNALRKKNHLNLRDRIQVWSFRVEEELYFALVKVSKKKEQETCFNGSNTNASTVSQDGSVTEYNSNNSS